MIDSQRVILRDGTQPDDRWPQTSVMGSRRRVLSLNGYSCDLMVAAFRS